MGCGANMKTYDFTMPWAPSINGYWRAVRGRQIISKRGRDYRKAAIGVLDGLGLSGERLKCRLSVSLVLNPPTLRKYDADNFCKGVFDALTEGMFWMDDEQVDRLTIIKGEKVKGGGVDVNVACYEEARH